MESLFIEVTDINFGKKIIGAIYRPPGNFISVFNNAFESLMSIVTRGKYECIIAGDYNIDLLKSENISELNILLIIYLLFPLYVLITKPTRYSTYSTTLIDNILTNKPQNNLVSEYSNI